MRQGNLVGTGCAGPVAKRQGGRASARHKIAPVHEMNRTGFIRMERRVKGAGGECGHAAVPPALANTISAF
jgi:hypothetical protein